VPSTPIELLLPPALDREAAVALLAKRLTLEVGRPRSEDRLVLDSFDGRLRAAGLRAERPRSRATSQTSRRPAQQFTLGELVERDVVECRDDEVGPGGAQSVGVVGPRYADFVSAG
jgi:hypothetical protein